MEGEDDILPNALSAMSIDDGPSRRAGIASLNNIGGSSDSLAGVVDGESYVSSSTSDHHHHHPTKRITSPPSHPQQATSDRQLSAETSISAGTEQQQQPQITIDDIPPEMREAFTQLDPDQQALALEMLAQQKLEQQQQQQMEEEMLRPDEHFLTIALNGKGDCVSRVCTCVCVEYWTTFLSFFSFLLLSFY